LSSHGYARVPGVAIEALADAWAAYSPLAGGSHVLNDSGAAVLDILAEHGPSSTVQVAQWVSLEVGLPIDEIQQALAPLWSELLAAGLVREVPIAACG